MSAKSALEAAFFHLGGVRWVRHRHARALRILMYHRFPVALDNFHQQCAHIARHYHPVSLAHAARARREGKPLPDNALAVTVDDGYRDFARAFPIFSEFGLPVTLFAVTGFIDRDLWLWPDETNFLFTETPLNTVEIAGTHYDLSTTRTRLQSRDAVNQRLIQMPNSERLQTLRDLPRLLHIELTAAPPHDALPLTWDELRALSRDGLDVGAHTCTHPILSRVDVSGLDSEIAASKHRLEDALDEPVTNFCYPNGTADDYSADVIEAVRRAGFETAVTTEYGLNSEHANLFSLCRMGVEPTLSIAAFARRIAGFRTVA